MAKEKKTALVVQLLGDDTKLAKSLTATQRRMKKFGGIGKSMAKGVAGAFAGLSAITATLGKQMVDLATDAGEAQSMFEVTFADALPKASGFIDEFAHKAGFAKHELQQLLGTSGAVMQGIDFTGEASADLSIKLATLAGDVASFSNAQGGAQAVMEAMTKSLLGENESLKTYGIAISQAEVQTKAFEMTGKTQASQLTKQEKALATYEMLLKKTTVQQGDLNRTQDSFANKSRKAQAQLKDMKVALGNELLPVAQELLPVLMDFAKSLNPSLTNAIKAFAPFLSTLAKLISALLPPIIQVISWILDKLQPAFNFLSDFVLDTLIPTFNRLPQAFEDMINKIIGKINNFFTKLNNFSSKIKGFFKKLGVDIDIPQLSLLGEKDFASGGKSVVASLDEIDQAREQAGMMAGTSAVAVQSAIGTVATNAGRVTTNLASTYAGSVSDKWNANQNAGGQTVVNVTTSPFQNNNEVAKELVGLLNTYEKNNGRVPIVAKSSRTII